MNKIVFAGKNADGERQNKYLEIIISGDAVVVAPPYCEYRAEGADFLRVYIEQPVTPLKEVVYFTDGDGMIRHAATAAKEFLKQEKSEAVLQALGNLLVSYVCFYADRKKFSPVVELVRQDIAKNLSNPAYALDDYLKNLPLNYDYVRKLFQKETGATPRAYLENARMELASNIISSGVTNKYSNYSVSQVAEACGFAEPLYFSRVFKKHFGVSPTEYKQ
ncbi:MAG: helix-turn-helix transcriptional regulator [Clostridia bacterium]|nr:helix-turn-helix transcriptional regulator [Clostridia bacterium]